MTTASAPCGSPVAPRWRSTGRVALLVLHVLLPLAAFAIAMWLPWWSMRNVFRVILFSEAGLLSVWAVLSPQPVLRRAVGWLAGLVLGFVLLVQVDSRLPSRKLVDSLLFPSAATIAFTLAIKRSPALRDDGTPGRWQFTVGQLLIITTTVAVLIAVVQQFWRSMVFVEPRLMASEGAQIGVVITAFAVLPRRWRWFRFAVGYVVIGAVGVIVQSFMSESWFWDALRNFRRVSAYQIWEDLVSIPAITLGESLFAAATLVVIYGNRNWSDARVTRRFSSFAVIPAAGVSARMGQPKLLLPLAGKTLIERTISAWQRSGVECIFVVLRADDAALAALVTSSGATVVMADPPPADMKASVRAGLDHIALNIKPSANDVWLTAPADLPSLSSEAVRRLLAAHDPRSPKVLVAAHQNQAGHPVLFPWSWAEEVATLADDEGLNRLVERAGAVLVECGAAANGRDLDTPDDYQRWKSAVEHLPS